MTDSTHACPGECGARITRHRFVIVAANAPATLAEQLEHRGLHRAQIVHNAAGTEHHLVAELLDEAWLMADFWYAVYATGFNVAVSPTGELLGALLLPAQVRTVRLASRPGEGRSWTTVVDALADYEPPDMRPAGAER